MELEVGKYYKLRNGERVKVLEVKRPCTHSVVIMYDNGTIGCRNANGFFCDDESEAYNDIIAPCKETRRVKLLAFANKDIGTSLVSRVIGYSTNTKNRKDYIRVPEFDKEIEIDN